MNVVLDLGEAARVFDADMFIDIRCGVAAYYEVNGLLGMTSDSSPRYAIATALHTRAEGKAW